MSDSTQGNGNKRAVKSVLAKKVLMPLVATAASAGASYVAKKGPRFFEDKILPRLRELASGANGAAHDLPGKAKSAAGGAGDVAQSLTDRAKSVATGGSSNETNGGGGGRARARQALTKAEREKQRGERAKHRASRRNTSTT